uniref:Tyrosine-protein kinase receptor Tie-1 n=1 Tax=Magallana gigas TaxID=29159 RepID=K1RAV5_MAGGI
MNNFLIPRTFWQRMWSYVIVEVVLLWLMVIGTSCFVNLVSEQGLKGKAAMGADPEKPDWTAIKAIDGNPSQDYQSDSCAITNVDENRCSSTRFSPGCGQLCSDKCKNNHCDAFNGSCIHGCSDPKAITIDCIACPNGKFISNKSCVDCPGHCKDGASCNKLTGMCDDGCANHWIGTLCNICSDHYYGTDCNTPCGHCKNNDVCDKGNGSCPNGCQSHWQGERCEVCQDRFYNATCSAICGHCIRRELCEKHDGTCISGCSQNFEPPLCQGML